MTKSKIFFFLPLLIFYLGCSKSPKQNGEDARFNDKRVVLQVADNKLTLGEVQKRFAATEFKDAQQEFETKKGFMETFLDRFMLIEGARGAGIVADVDSSIIRRNLLKQLYNERIMNKINVTDGDIGGFFKRYGGEVQSGHILVADSSLADSLYKAIKNGADFEKLAKDFSKDEGSADKGGSLGYVPYGRFEDKYQDTAFGMKIGEVSRPIRTRYGWHIIKLYDRIKNADADLEKDKNRYRDLTNQYQQKTMVKEFVRQVRSNYHYKVVRPTYDMLVHKADSVKAAGIKPQGLPGSAYLDSSVVSEAERRMFLVEYDGGGVTVGDYLELLKGYSPQRAPELNDREMMDSILEGMAMPVLLEKMALKEGINNTETFKRDIEFVQGSDLMQKMKNKIYGTIGNITEQDIVKYYNEHRDDFFLPDQIRASGIAVKTREEAQELLTRAKGGANFVQLAKKYSLDKKTGSEGGDLNYFTVARNTPIYQAGENLKIGNMGGPVQMEGNWWIFMVTGRIAKTPKTLDLARPDIPNRIGQEWRDKAYKEWMTNMMAKTKYTMDLELVRSTLKIGSLPAAEKSKG